MSKSRHKRHVHLLDKLYSLGWDTEYVRPAYFQTPRLAYVGIRGMFNLSRHKFFTSATNERGPFVTPPLPHVGQIIFILVNRSKEARILYGWRELPIFAVDEERRQKARKAKFEELRQRAKAKLH